MKKILALSLVIILVMTSGTMAFAAKKGTADESLSKLAVSKSESTSSSKLYDMFPEFDPEIADYTVLLPDGKDSVYIYAKPDDKDYTVYCDDDEVYEDDDYFIRIDDISDGDEVEIVVEDEDDDKIDTYTITFYCGDEDDNDDDLLESLEIKNKTDSSEYDDVDLDEKFDEDETSYTCSIRGNSYKKIRVYAEASDSDAHVFINGYEAGSSGYVEFDAETGTNKFTVTVVAENCDDTKTYTVTANYKEDVEAALASLSARDSSSNNITLSPVFYSSRKNYTADVASTVETISFFLATTETDCSIYLDNMVQSNNAWTQGIALKEGLNNFNITVKANSGNNNTATYSVSVYKQAKGLESFVSSQKLTINGISKQLNAYNINGNNFVKLRDIASLLQGTGKQFSVAYDANSNRISLLSGGYYTSNGQENIALAQPKEITSSEQSVYLDNVAVNMMAYNIDGNNFVMLRDLGLLLNFSVSYNSATDTIQINTTQNYTAN